MSDIMSAIIVYLEILYTFICEHMYKYMYISVAILAQAILVQVLKDNDWPVRGVGSERLY